MAETVAMYPCRECCEYVPASDCYVEFDEVMHAMGVTGQAEPHEAGCSTDELKHVDVQTFANPSVESQNGPRLLSPRLARNDYFEHHDYTLTVADAVSIRLTERQARDLYQQLHEEFKPRTVL